MEIKFKDTSNSMSRAKTRPGVRTPFSHPSHPSESLSTNLSALSPFNIYEERPLKTNSQNLSFKGLFVSYKPANQLPYNANEILAIAKKHLDSSAEDLFNHLKSSKLNSTKEMFSVNEKNEVMFKKKTTLRLIYDSVVYPVKILPGEILNGAVKLLKKVKPLETWADDKYNSNFLKNIRQRSKNDSQVSSLRGIFEKISSLKDKPEEMSSKTFQQSVKMLDVASGNYDTKIERSWCRVVSGFVPAFFLSNDAYNLSRMCDDNKKEADKEKKIRFKQETSRVLFNAYLTLITMGALQKITNNSKTGNMLITGITVLFTEMTSRLTNGKHITRLSADKAKAINAKNNPNKNEEKDSKNPEYKEVFFKATEGKKSFSAFNDGKAPEFKGYTEAKTSEQKKQEPLLSFSTIMKASAVVIAAGFGIKGLRKIKSVDNVFKKAFEPFNKAYKKLTVDSDFTYDKVKLNEITDKLEGAGFPQLAKKYQEVAAYANKLNAIDVLKSKAPKEFKPLEEALTKELKQANKDARLTNDHVVKVLEDSSKNAKYSELTSKYNNIINEITNSGKIHLGAKNKKVKPLVDFVKTPFEFAWDAVSLPYNLVQKVVKACGKSKPPSPGSDVSALAKSVEKIGKMALDTKNFDQAKFKDFVNDSIVKSFNADTMSNISNSELANLAKTSATAATLWFLMADNYNMVMLKSNGEDKEGANLKSKERFVQEMSRLFYQTLLISLFNNTFRAQYNNSLFGVTWITAGNTFVGEILNRKSVGMPIKPQTRDELIEIQENKENATGFTKSYYDFMAKLTGKKSLSEQHIAKQSSKTK